VRADYERLQQLVPRGISPAICAGFPGWHIECSAMSRLRLGPVIDLHTGGEDDIFPHHECEIAQSYGARLHADAPISFSRYWVHARHLLVNGAKMSKRDGTLISVKSLLDPARSGPSRCRARRHARRRALAAASVATLFSRCALARVGPRGQRR
jgi:cysteinyl-tRNA synthetase